MFGIKQLKQQAASQTEPAVHIPAVLDAELIATINQLSTPAVKVPLSRLKEMRQFHLDKTAKKVKKVKKKRY